MGKSEISDMGRMDNSNPNAASSSTTTSNSGISSSSSSFVSPQLSINHIIGTSASSPNHFSVQGNVLAYTASGGVVVRQLNSKDGSVVTERFFCANSSSHNDPSAASQSSADAYLNMALSDLGGDSSPKEVGRDSFGYPISSEPIIIGGNNLGASSSEINGGINDIDLSSPSKLKNRVRSINCICLSPNKKILAVGEKGYQPRILIFSLAPDSNSSPVLVIHEHTFGINTICFSPDSKYLCSLGFVNDGFINVWKLSTASVQMLASNRCSSIINQLIWHEDYILTLGLRLIKVWRFTEAEADSVIDKPCVLKGKNVLLGHMINSNFTNASILNDDELLIITSYNQLLLLKLGSELRLIDLVIPPFDFDTLLVDYEHEKIWFGLPDSSIDHYKISELKERKVTQSVSPVTRMTSVFGSQSKEQKVRVPILKLANFSADYLVYLTDAEEIVLYNKALEQDETTLASSLIKDLAGIKDCNLGELLVYSKDGLVKRVLSDSDKLETVIKFNLPSNELISNSLTALDAIAESVILGDKYGNLYVVEPFSEDTYKTHYQVKAHSSSINDMVYYEIENYQLITSISRDRMIQFFFRLKDGGEWDILQTVPVHNGNLLKIQYQDNRIYVCSSDRTISIHNISVIDDELVVFQEKIISVKSSPINVKIFQDDLVVSTNDRSLTIYDITQSFELKRTLKFTNEKTNESLLVENFIVFKNVIITSSSDKSLRVFNYATGKQLSLAWGHSDVIVSLILDANNNLVSIGKDGCLFSWKLEEPNLDKLIQASSTHDEQDDSIENTPLYSKVTRKILPTSPIKLNIPKGEPDRLDIPSPKSLAPNSKSPTQSPRLTTATLKRIEARRNSLSPTKPLAPENSRSKSVSTIKTAPMVPTLQKAQTTTNLPSPTRSPVASPTKSPFRSPTRSLAGSPVRSIVAASKSPSPSRSSSPTRSIEVRTPRAEASDNSDLKDIPSLRSEVSSPTKSGITTPGRSRLTSSTKAMAHSSVNSNTSSPSRSPLPSPSRSVLSTRSAATSTRSSLASEKRTLSPVKSLSKRTSGDISPLKAPRVSLSAASERVSARKKPTPLSFVDKTLWELEQIEYTLQEDELEDKDRERIFSKVEAIFRLLGGKSDGLSEQFTGNDSTIEIDQLEGSDEIESLSRGIETVTISDTDDIDSLDSVEGDEIIGLGLSATEEQKKTLDDKTQAIAEEENKNSDDEYEHDSDEEMTEGSESPKVVDAARLVRAVQSLKFAIFYPNQSANNSDDQDDFMNSEEFARNDLLGNSERNYSPSKSVPETPRVDQGVLEDNIPLQEGHHEEEDDVGLLEKYEHSFASDILEEEENVPEENIKEKKNIPGNAEDLNAGEQIGELPREEVDEASCEHSLGDPITLVHHDATKNKDPTEKMDVIELLEKYSDKLIALVETKLDARNKPKHFTHLLFNEAIHNHSTSPSKDTLVDNPFD